MHIGRLPATNHSNGEYARGPWQATELDGASPSRRGFLIAAIGSITFGGAGWYAGRRTISHAPAAQVEKKDDAAAALPSGSTPAWYPAMLTLGDEQLLRRAGDFERLSRSCLDNPRIVPGFLRLLRVASHSPQLGAADPACACAVRTLVKLGRADVVHGWLLSNPQLATARGEARFALRDVGHPMLPDTKLGESR